ncbi:protein FAM98B isoform X1 [Entelurus aequoreus]|uniref:protein FAM98B isoform X1 n=2 Tax=Entelurus aequoreus TaxID=161455 RepID=UPI002B1DB1F6|nr:protein FAM98B isoform X1 [Entelurus aequoreus]
MECDILDSLEQLGYEGPVKGEADLLLAAKGGLTSAEYVDLCRWLVSRLKSMCDLEGSITSGPDDVTSMSGLLKELCCPYDMCSLVKGNAEDHLKILLFLSSELQAAQIASSRGNCLQGQNESLASRELRTICETLTVSPLEGKNVAEVLSLIQNKVDTLLKKCPNGAVEKPALKQSLSSEQWEKLHDMNTVLSSEYECRRRMLIKRLDVTIQSFGWSDRAKVKVDSMARAYQPKRHNLRAESTVDATTLLAAREDVCNIVKTSSGVNREKTACAVNKIQMGRVPDRGGRPSEIQAPPPEMPQWKARQDGGGDWGRRGGWGGRGGGGGGKWRGGRPNHGGHGGKRGRYQY